MLLEFSINFGNWDLYIFKPDIGRGQHENQNFLVKEPQNHNFEQKKKEMHLQFQTADTNFVYSLKLQLYHK